MTILVAGGGDGGGTFGLSSSFGHDGKSGVAGRCRLLPVITRFGRLERIDSRNLEGSKNAAVAWLSPTTGQCSCYAWCLMM